MQTRIPQVFARKAGAVLWAASLLSLIPVSLSAQSPSRPIVWDQKKAKAIVQGVLALEMTGQPWDKIAWLTPEEAVARARKENKPLFIYFFLQKPVGPATAPC